MPAGSPETAWISVLLSGVVSLPVPFCGAVVLRALCPGLFPISLPGLFGQAAGEEQYQRLAIEQEASFFLATV